MRLRLWTTVEDGIYKAHLQITEFTSLERTQAAKFGPCTVNIGGAFAQVTPPVNFSLEPINLTIDAESGQDVTYEKIFRETAEIPNPEAAANLFCTRNQTTVADAVTDWKNLTDSTVSYNTIL